MTQNINGGEDANPHRRLINTFSLLAYFKNEYQLRHLYLYDIGPQSLSIIIKSLHITLSIIFIYIKRSFKSPKKYFQN